jgi:hypothetical protein
MQHRRVRPRCQRRSPLPALIARASKLCATTADITAELTMAPVTAASRSRLAMLAGVTVVSGVVATPARAIRRRNTPPTRAGGVPGFGLISKWRPTCAASKAARKTVRAGRSSRFGIWQPTPVDAFHRAMVMSNARVTCLDGERILGIVVGRGGFEAEAVPLRPQK